MHFLCSTIGGQLGPLTFHLGHFGIGPKQNEQTAKFDLRKVLNFVKAKDNSGAEMSMSGAKELNETIDILHTETYGSVSMVIVKGKAEEIMEKIKYTNPLICDILPLTLEEVFIYELGGMGYEFENIIL